MRRLVVLLMLVLTFSIGAFAGNPGYAADVTAIASGDWTGTFGESVWDTGGAPSAFDDAIIEDGYTVSISGTDAAMANAVRLGQTDGSTGYLYQDGGELSVTTYMHIGHLGTGVFTLDDGTVDLSTYVTVGSGTDATGTVHQSGGAFVTANDILVGKYGVGTYNLNGGTLDGTSEGSDLIVGYAATGSGTFNQYAGTTVSLGYTCLIGYSGTAIYNMSGGSLTADRFISVGRAAGGNGTVNQSGGTISTDDDILVGHSGAGVYNMTGGEYNGTGEGSDLLMGRYAGSNGTFNQSAGAVTLGHALWVADLGTAEYKMTDGSLSVASYISVGRSTSETATGNGTINQSGGTITAGDDVLVGHYGVGEYNMTGGSLTTTAVGSDLIVGTYSGSVGAFSQSAGATIAIHDHVYVGYSASGEYDMTGGSLSATGSLYVGQYGSSVGTLNQSSGVVSITDTAWIADYSTSTGTYTLSGDATANFASDLNVCAALGYDGESSPSGATGALNIEGEDVTLSVGGNLVATGGSVVDPEGVWENSSVFNFTTGSTGDVSTIDVTGYADIDCAIFDIIESSAVAGGTVLDLIEADGGINNFATATLGPNAAADWTLQLGGFGDNILQAVKTISTAIPGDTNGDNAVDATDAKVLATMWGSTTLNGASEGDFNGDKIVNVLDAAILAANWTASTTDEGTAVPEPGAVALVFTGLLGLAIRRRR